MEPQIIKTAEQLTDKVIDRAIDNPLEAIRTADAILSIAVNALPTLPWETPLPIPRGIYEKFKAAEGK